MGWWEEGEQISILPTPAPIIVIPHGANSADRPIRPRSGPASHFHRGWAVVKMWKNTVSRTSGTAMLILGGFPGISSLIVLCQLSIMQFFLSMPSVDGGATKLSSTGWDWI